MSTDVILSVIILSIFVFIILYLTRTKTKKTLVKNTAVGNRKVSFDGAVNDLLNEEIKVNESTFLFTNITIEEGFLHDFSNFSILTEKYVTSEDQKITDQIVKGFRKPHPLLLSLTQGVFEPNELFDLIKTDPEMTAKILKVVNSPLFSLRQPITSINHAIIFLGVNSVKNIAMQLAVQTSINDQDHNQGAAHQKLWVASSMASSLCLLIAKELGRDNAAELSTHCLLSYLGDMAIISYEKSAAKSYIDEASQYLRIDNVQNKINTNSALVGKKIAQEWELPTSIIEGIAHSLLPLTFKNVVNEISDEKMADILICYISCRLGDFVSFNKMTDISQLETLLHDPKNSISFYFIKDKIEEAGLGQLHTLFADPTFKRKANKIMEQT